MLLDTDACSGIWCTLTCCTVRCRAAKCGPKERAAFPRRRTRAAPKTTCSRTRSANYHAIYNFIWLRISFKINKGNIMSFTCSTHKFVVIIWFLRFWNKNNLIREEHGEEKNKLLTITTFIAKWYKRLRFSMCVAMERESWGFEEKCLHGIGTKLTSVKKMKCVCLTAH